MAGQPGVKDEPQHLSQGNCMIDLLKSINAPYKILPNDINEARAVIDELDISLKNLKKPHFLVVKKNTFSKYDTKIVTKDSYNLERHIILEKIVNVFKKEIIISTTGKSSREILNYFNNNKMDKSRLFLNVGAMGRVMIAIGIAMHSNKKIVCIDGDGSIIMHMGNLTSIGTSNSKIIFIINNGMHQSVEFNTRF